MRLVTAGVALLAASAAIAETQIVSLEYGNIQEESIESAAEFIGDEIYVIEDVLSDRISKDRLPRTTLEGISYIALSSVGRYDFNKLTQTVTVRVRPELLGTTKTLDKDANLRKPSGNIVGVTGDLQGSFRRDEGSRTNGFFDARTAIGIPYVGSLYTGFRYIDVASGTKVVRQNTFLMKDLESLGITLNVGEVSGQIDRNAASEFFLGASIERNLRLVDDAFLGNRFDFVLPLDGPSKIDLFQNGARVFATSTREATNLSLDGYQPSVDGDIDIVVTDVAGNQRVLRVPYYNFGQRLGKGEYLFFLGAGQSIDQLGEAGEDLLTLGNFGVGLGGGRTLNFGAGWRDSGESGYFGQGVASLGFSALGMGFEVAAAGSTSPLSDGGSARVATLKTTTLNRARISYGASVEKQYAFQSTIDSRPIDRAFGRLFFNITSGRNSGGASYFRDDFENQVSVVRYSRLFGGGFIGSLQHVMSNDDFASTVSVSYTFKNHLVSVRGGSNTAGDDTVGFNYSGSYRDNSIRLDAGYEQSENYEIEPFEGRKINQSLSLGFNDPIGNAEYVYRDLEGTFSHSLGFSTGFGFFPGRGKLAIGNNFSSLKGIGFIDTNYKGLKTSAGGASGVTDKNGDFIVPLSRYFQSRVNFDDSDLADGAFIKQERYMLRAKPGFVDVQQIVVRGAGQILKSKNLNEGDLVTVNGNLEKVSDFGLFTESLVLGKNEIKKGNRIWNFDFKPRGLAIEEWEIGDGEISN